MYVYVHYEAGNKYVVPLFAIACSITTFKKSYLVGKLSNR